MAYDPEAPARVNRTQERLDRNKALPWFKRAFDRFAGDYPAVELRHELDLYKLGPTGRIQRNIGHAVASTLALRDQSVDPFHIARLVGPEIQTSIATRISSSGSFHRLFEALGLPHEASGEVLPPRYEGSRLVRPAHRVDLGTGVYSDLRNKGESGYLGGIYTASDTTSPINRVDLTNESVNALDPEMVKMLESFTATVDGHAAVFTGVRLPQQQKEPGLFERAQGPLYF